MASKKIIEKLTGRVFGHLETKGGGNPITVFASRDERSVLSKAQREHLATTCAWESVFVNASSTTTTSHPQMAFYMPTGEQVSFCAHAALAGTTALSDQADEERNVQFQTEDFTGIESNPGNIYTSTLHDRNIVSVDMTAEWTEEPVHSPSLYRMLRECHNLHSKDLVKNKFEIYWCPTFVNSSVARNKTIINVTSVDILHNLQPPIVSPDSYRRRCDALNTTGLYFYASHPDEQDTWECRQFPRASGYPEDPATGIAAAALALSLKAGDNGNTCKMPNLYRFYQGTAMGKPSLILVEITHFEKDVQVNDQTNNKVPQKGKVSFTLYGQMEVDNVEKIEVEDEKLMTESSQ